MTSPARQREADRAATAYQLALSQIGVQTIGEAIKLWDHVPPQARREVAVSWLHSALQLITGKRTESVQLARAYYRLTRALLTGTTVADPNKPDPPNITLGDLRRQFATLAGSETLQESEKRQASTDAAAAPDAPEEPVQADENDPEEDDDNDRILVEEIARLQEQEDAVAAAAEDEILTALEALGPVNQNKLTDEIDKKFGNNPNGDFLLDDYKNALSDAHDKAGVRQAAAAARLAMDGGRSTTWVHQENDKRAIGYVRVSLTGTPCGWCAMLISRGAVYRSKQSAEYADGDKYHDNCHCIAVPVFTRDQFDNSSKFNLNRLYAEQWPVVTKGLGGDSALSAWRRFIRQEAAAAKRRPAA